MNYLDLLDQSVKNYPDRTAVTDRTGTRNTSYRELDALSKKAAGKLQALGARKGDFIVLLMNRSLEYLAAYLGALRSGCAAVPLIPQYPEQRIRFIEEDCRAKVVVKDGFFDDIGAYGPVSTEASEEDPALLIYTSGSTGTPKGVLHTVKGLYAAVKRQQELVEGIPGFRVAASAPFSFIVHISETLMPLSVGGTVHILPDEMRTSVRAITAYYEKYAIDGGFLSPQILKLIHDENFRPKRIFTGSEKLSGVYFPAFEVWNVFGQSETASGVCRFLVDRPYDSTPIGKPMGDVTAHILKENGEEAAAGETGEICFDGLFGAGYFKDPERTKTTFVSIENETTCVKTGDLGYKNSNGDIVYVSRADFLVKVNGQRVELTEVESGMQKVSGVTDAAAGSFTDRNGQTFLAGFYVAGEEIPDGTFRERLSEFLPSYMIPRFLVRIPKIPRNLNGKTDRKALSLPEENGKKTGEQENLSEQERKLLSLIGEITGYEAFGAEESLLNLGLTSITAIRLSERIENEYGAEVSPVQLLSGLSVRDLCRILAENAGKNAEKETVPAAPKRSAYPLGSSQLGVYYDVMKNPAGTAYNVPFCGKLSGIDPERLYEAVRETVRKRPFLNTFVRQGEEGIFQIRNDEAEPAVEYLSLSGPELEAYKENFVRPFDVYRWPLYRISVVKTGAQSALLLFDIHHLIFDGTSVNLLVSSIDEAYRTGTCRAETETAFDAALSEKDYDRSAQYREDETYLGNLFRDAEAPGEVPPDRNGKESDGKMALFMAELPKEDVLSFCRNEGITPSGFFLAAVSLAVSRFSGERKVILSTISSGRSNPSVRGAVGMFVKTVPVSLSFEPETTAGGYLKAATESMLGGIRHENYPFADLAAKYGYRTELMYECQLSLIREPFIGGVPCERLPLGEETLKFKCAAVVTEENDAIRLTVKYNDALYSAGYMETFARSVKNACLALMGSPAQRVLEISLLSEEERRKVESFGRTETGEIPGKTLHGMLERACSEYSGRTALMAKDRSLTFSELNAEANRIARNLKEKGLSKGDRVLLLLPRRSYYFTALFAVLKCGAAFIPCDPSYPAERIAHITGDSDAKYILTARECPAACSGENVLFIEDLFCGEDDGNLPSEATGEDLAYLIYTSGSTGKPKGVELRHAGACNYFTRSRANLLYDLCAEQVSTMMSITTVSFDLGLKCSVGMMVNGISVVFAAEDEMNDAKELARLMREHHADGLNATPSRISMYLEVPAFAEELKKCRVVAAGGENYPESLLTKLRDLGIPHLINTYGPTEVTISSNMADLRDAARISVGKPLRNYTEAIVDADGNLLPVGVTGELYVGGPGVARGYRNLPEKTAERFVFYRGNRVFKTGDYARWDPDGNVEILGRKDGQVKLRGLRIELSEIERVMEREPGIRKAVLEIRTLSGEEHLCAYFTADRVVDPSELRENLKKTLTGYMVPTAYLQLPEIPVTPNGKTDRRALPEPKLCITLENVPPSGYKEEMLLKAAKEVLPGIDFGVTDDLFSLGMTSLTAIRYAAKISEFDRFLRVSDIMRFKTVRALSGNMVLISWLYNGYSEQKPTLLFVSGIIPLGDVLAMSRVLAEDFNILVIEPLTDHYDRIFDGDTIEDVAEFYLIQAELRIPGGKIDGLVGFSYGGELCALMAERLKERTGQQPFVLLGDSYLHRRKKLSGEEMEKLLREASEEKDSDMKKKDVIVKKLGNPSREPFYDGKVIFLNAHLLPDGTPFAPEYLRGKLAGSVKAFPQLEIIEMEEMNHEDLFRKGELYPVYRELLGRVLRETKEESHE